MNTKIYIIGGLGSGKSFLASKLSHKIGIEHFDLDKIVFLPSTYNERKENDRAAILSNILEKEEWILEGTYTEEWIISGLEKADSIIYLSTFSLIRLFRFLKRIWKQGVFRQEDLFGRTKLVLGYKYKEWDRTHEKYENILEPFKHKVINLRSQKEVQQYLHNES